MARSQPPADDPREIIRGPNGWAMAGLYIVVGYLIHASKKFDPGEDRWAIEAAFIVGIVYFIFWLQAYMARRRLAALRKPGVVAVYQDDASR